MDSRQCARAAHTSTGCCPSLSRGRCAPTLEHPLCVLDTLRSALFSAPRVRRSPDFQPEATFSSGGCLVLAG
eukprot:7095471-Prymnesium_polylepis.1